MECFVLRSNNFQSNQQQEGRGGKKLALLTLVLALALALGPTFAFCSKKLGSSIQSTVAAGGKGRGGKQLEKDPIESTVNSMENV